MKGIILAGGSGTRLYPLTKTISKQLMPVYDKPMIYYPLSVLMLAGIKEIAIISTLEDLPNFIKLLGSGEELGVKFTYILQQNPNGIAEAFLLAENFIDKDDVCLILGDNIFYGENLSDLVKNCVNPKGGIVFAYHVNDPERYGVVEFDSSNKVISIEEKPITPKSNYAIPGIYFYDNSVVEKAKSLKPSKRGELEITDINLLYLEENNLRVEVMNRGYAWLDTGTHKSLLDASMFIEIIESRQGLKIGCIEEIAYKMNFITKEQLNKLAQPLLKSGYGEYLLKL